MTEPTTRRTWLAAAPIAALGAGLGATASPEAPAQIRDLLDVQVADWNRGDLDAFLAGYWDSPEVVFQSGGDQRRGFAAMRDRYRARYRGEGREMGTLAFRDLEILPLGADAALVRGRWGLTMADGKAPGGLFTLVVRRFGAAWKIVHDHTSSA